MSQVGEEIQLKIVELRRSLYVEGVDLRNLASKAKDLNESARINVIPMLDEAVIHLDKVWKLLYEIDETIQARGLKAKASTGPEK